MATLSLLNYQKLRKQPIDLQKGDLTMKKTYTIFACLFFSLIIAGTALAEETLDSSNETITDPTSSAGDLTGIKL